MDLQLIETLEYYDTIQLFIGVDQVASFYICMLVEQNDLEDTYLCASISMKRLKEFKAGKIDLRELFVVPESRDRMHCIETENASYGTHTLYKIDYNKIPRSWFPSKGRTK